MFRPVQPPVRGTSNARSFIDTPGDLVPYVLNSAGKPIGRNFLPYTPASRDRHVIGQRAGLSKLFPQQSGAPGGSPWQCLVNVSRASVIADYQIGDCFSMTEGLSLESGVITGNYFQLDSVPSSDGIGALGTGSVNASAVCPARKGTDEAPYYACFVSSNTSSGGFGIATIRAFRDDTGATLWTYVISEASVDRFINTMTASDNFLFVCTGAVVLMIRVSDGTLVSTETLSGWAQEAIEGAVYKNLAGSEWYFIGFNGSNLLGATQTTGGATIHVIEAGNPATQFRAGVQRFSINNEYVTAIGPYSSDPLVKEPLGWGQTLDEDTGFPDNASTNYNEGFHGYFRISERSQVTGHGCLITALAVHPTTGAVFIARTNEGYGPNSGFDSASGLTFQPDGNTFPPITVMGISFAGERLWESDTFSLKSLEVGMAGLPNDIPLSSADDPSISAIRCNARGEICVGGRQNDGFFSIFGIDAEDGALQWQANLMNTGLSVRQGAMAVDPGDGHFVIGGDRNANWDGHTGSAHVWKVHSQTGEVLWHFDLSANVSALTVAMRPSGGIVYGTDFI